MPNSAIQDSSSRLQSADDYPRFTPLYNKPTPAYIRTVLDSIDSVMLRCYNRNLPVYAGRCSKTNPCCFSFQEGAV